MIPVLYEDNHVLCVVKPPDIPVQADSSHDEDLLTILKKYLKEKYHKPGNVYLGLVHRLDRPVGGVMVFAKTSKAASRLSESIRTNQLHKEYLAVVQGSFSEKKGTYVDYLIKDHRKNMVRTTDPSHGKKSILHYEVLQEREGKSLVHILLETGRSHQIRVQFSTHGHPLIYDQKYNPSSTRGHIALFAYRLTFPHPTKKEPVTVSALPEKKDPWNLFEVSL